MNENHPFSASAETGRDARKESSAGSQKPYVNCGGSLLNSNSN